MATGATGPTGADGSKFKFSVNPGYLAAGNAQAVDNGQAIYFATRTPDKLKVTIEKSDPTGAAVWLDSIVPSPTGAPVVLPAATYAMRTGAETIKDTNILPYQTLIKQPSDGSIQMDDRTLVLTNSGNYLISFSLSCIGTNGVPNIHVILDDAAGHTDVDAVNVLQNSMVSATVALPVQGPGRLQIQLQGSGAEAKTPGNQPQGLLSVVKIG